MDFLTFIDNLSEEDKKNYEKYSKIRGCQQYRIIYETLAKIDSNVTYKDVNAFIRFDKAIKDVLFKYLGTLEEEIRNYILLNYDFDSTDNLKEKYVYFDNKFPKSNCVKKSIKPYEITEFYRRFALNFGAMVLFIKEFKIEKYDSSKLDIIVELRNNVMHHAPLLFNCDFESTTEETLKKINILLDLLSNDYKCGFMAELKEKNGATRGNILKRYYCFLLFKEE